MSRSSYSYQRVPVAEYFLVFAAIISGFLADWENFRILSFTLLVWLVIHPPASRTLTGWSLLMLILASFSITFRQLDRANEFLALFYLLLAGVLLKTLDEKRKS